MEEDFLEKTFYEQLVKKTLTLTQASIRYFSLGLAIAVSYALLVLIGVFSLVLVFFIGVGVYFIFLYTSVEYEYQIAGDRLSVDCIYGKKIRKAVAVYELSKCDVIAPRESTYVSGYDRNKEMKTYDFTSDMSGEDIYIMVTGYGASNAKVYFQPNEKMVGIIRNVVPSKIKN